MDANLYFKSRSRINNVIERVEDRVKSRGPCQGISFQYCSSSIGWCNVAIVFLVLAVLGGCLLAAVLEDWTIFPKQLSRHPSFTLLSRAKFDVKQRYRQNSTINRVRQLLTDFKNVSELCIACSFIKITKPGSV